MGKNSGKNAYNVNENNGMSASTSSSMNANAGNGMNASASNGMNANAGNGMSASANNKQNMSIPPSATYVPMTSEFEKKMGKSSSSQEGLNASTQNSVGQ